jgi:hypothetical protein
MVKIMENIIVIPRSTSYITSLGIGGAFIPLHVPVALMLYCGAVTRTIE